MTSRNSFWKLSVFNIKKRIWTFALAMGLLFCMMPVATFMSVNTTLRNAGITDFSSVDGIWMMDTFIGDVAASGLYGIVTVIMATIFALQGFSYLQSQNKVDMYKSVPVKENTRFAYIVINSIVGYMAIFIVNILLVDLYFAVRGIFTVAVLKATLFSIAYNFVVFSSVYFLTSISALLCGSTVLAFFGSLVFLFIEPIISGLLEAAKSVFFATYYSDYTTETITNGVLTPVGECFKIWDICNNGGTHFYYDGTGYGKCTAQLLILLLQAVIYGVLAFLVYKKRPAQIGGKSIVFKPMKWVIKIVILVIGISGTAYFFAEIAGIYDDLMILYGFIGIALSFIILHCVLQTILEKDFRECLHGIPTSLIALGISVAVYCFLAFDMVGYDSYLPDADQVTGFSMMRSCEFNHNYYDEDDNYLDNTKYILENAVVKDPAIIKEALGAIEDAMDQGAYVNGDYDADIDEGQEYVDVCYQLSNGKNVYRSYELKPETVRTLFTAVYSDDNYRQTLEEINSPIYANAIEDIGETHVSFSYCSYGFPYNDAEVSDQDVVQEIYDALVEAVNTRDASVILDEPAIGSLEINIEEKGMSEYGQTADYTDFYSACIPIYESDEKVIAILKEYDLYQDVLVNKSDISEIDCNDYSNEDYMTEVLVPGDEKFDDYYERFVPISSTDRMLEASLYADENIDINLVTKDGYGVEGYLKYGELAE